MPPFTGLPRHGALPGKQFGHGPCGLAIAVEFGNFERRLITVRGEKPERRAISSGRMQRHASAAAFPSDRFDSGEQHLTDAHSAGVFAHGNGVEMRDDGMRPRSKWSIERLERHDCKPEQFAVFFSHDRPSRTAVDHSHDRGFRGVRPSGKSFEGQAANEIVVVLPSKTYCQKTGRAHAGNCRAKSLPMK